MWFRVLIGDPDNQLYPAYRRIFEKVGFELAWARNGVECLALVETFKPDVLILDSDLLWGGAEGVLAVLRDKEGWSDMPTLLATGTSSVREISQRLHLPEACCVQKPFSVISLIDRLSERIENETSPPTGHTMSRGCRTMPQGTATR